jgi:hypothetical protein
MKTFDFKTMSAAPAQCLCAAGPLLDPGCRMDAGLPRFRAARRPEVKLPAIGGKAPGVWGTPGADSVPEPGAFAEGGNGVRAGSVQWSRGGISLKAREFLLFSAGVSPRVAVHARDIAGAVLRALGMTAASGETSVPRGETSVEVRNVQHVFFNGKVIFVPKPDPWNGFRERGGKALKSSVPGSFFRKAVIFTPTPNPSA